LHRCKLHRMCTLLTLVAEEVGGRKTGGQIPVTSAATAQAHSVSGGVHTRAATGVATKRVRSRRKTTNIIVRRSWRIGHLRIYRGAGRRPAPVSTELGAAPGSGSLCEERTAETMAPAGFLMARNCGLAAQGPSTWLPNRVR